MAIFVAMLGMGIVNPLLPVYANTMGATGMMLGFMSSGYALSRAITQPIYGWFSDKQSRKRLLIVGLSWYTIISVAYAFAPNIWWLIAVRLAHGLASAAVIPVAQAYVGDIVPRGKEGTYMGLFSMAQYLGMAAGPFMGGTLFDIYQSMAPVFYYMAALAGAGLLLLILFVPSFPPPVKKKGEKGTSMWTMLRDNKIKAVAIYLGTRGILRQSISSFLPLFALQTFGLSTGEAGSLVSVYILTEALSQTFVGPIADRFNRKALMIAGGLVTCVLGLFLNRMTSSFSMLLLLIPIALMATVGRVPALAYNVELGKRYGRMGSSMGITNAAQDFGHFIGPMITGWAIDNLGINTVFYTGSIAGLIALPLMAYWLFAREPEYAFQEVTQTQTTNPPK